jgi:arsenate reductase
MNVLFVCEDNSALSIMAEAIVHGVAPRQFAAYSAGCLPHGALNADALEVLEMHRMPTAFLRSKSLQTFRSSPHARVDFVITLSELAAEQDFSAWPGEPFVAHWHVEDDGTGEALPNSFWTLLRRIKTLTSPPQGKLDRRRLQRCALSLEPSYL